MSTLLLTALPNPKWSKVKIKLAARLILWGCYWRKTGPVSACFVGFYDAYLLLYKGITGEGFIQRYERFPSESTIRGLWRYRQQILVDCFLVSNWTPTYATDPALDVRQFFLGVGEFVEHLNPDEQFDLLLETAKCHDEIAAAPLRKLFKSE